MCVSVTAAQITTNKPTNKQNHNMLFVPEKLSNKNKNDKVNVSLGHNFLYVYVYIL